MEGDKYREKRETVEGLYEKINALIAKKSVGEAKRKLQKTKKIVDELSLKISGEIQERSLFNLRIKGDYLSEDIEKLEMKNR